MRRINIIYWILTGLISVLLGIGAVFNAISAPEGVEVFANLGYPAYLVPFLGIAKLAGIAAILLPGFPRIKEWAYAGLSYDLLGALYSHIAMGVGPSAWFGLVVGLLMIAGSYFYYHKRMHETQVAIVNQE